MANTRNTMGEQACLDAIISGTITDFEDDTVRTLCGYALACCPQLTRVSLPECLHADAYAFYNCTSLAVANLPNVTELGYNAFERCLSLESIVMQSLIDPGHSTFVRCQSLVSATFPVMRYVPPNMFSGCSSLMSVTFGYEDAVVRSKFAIGMSGAFGNTPIATGEGTIYVPAHLVDDYRAHEFFGQYNIAPIAG